jgi:hypothetical protein
MNEHPTSTEMSRGRETAPFPGTPSPKTNLGRLHKSLDTPTPYALAGATIMVRASSSRAEGFAKSA